MLPVILHDGKDSAVYCSLKQSPIINIIMRWFSSIDIKLTFGRPSKPPSLTLRIIESHTIVHLSGTITIWCTWVKYIFSFYLHQLTLMCLYH